MRLYSVFNRFLLALNKLACIVVIAVARNALAVQLLFVANVRCNFDNWRATTIAHASRNAYFSAVSEAGALPNDYRKNRHF